MKGEFLRVITQDGLELQGLLVSPTDRQGGSQQATSGWGRKTAVLHIHGLSGNFYENRFVDHVAEAVARSGAHFLPFNNRGHDYISDFIWTKPDSTLASKQIGGIYEMLDECVLDIHAFVEFLRGRGFTQIILQGHSHGAVKAVHYLERQSSAYVSGLILLSPSDDFGLQRQRLGRRFDEALAHARNMVSEGAGRDLMPTYYFHSPISAETFLDSFGSTSRLKIFNLSETDTRDFPELEHIRLPTLAIVGSVDEAFLGPPKEFVSTLGRRFKNATDFTGHVIDGAPHNYLGHEAGVAGHIHDWLQARFA